MAHSLGRERERETEMGGLTENSITKKKFIRKSFD